MFFTALIFTPGFIIQEKIGGRIRESKIAPDFFVAILQSLGVD
jgi:hypothetical protein